MLAALHSRDRQEVARFEQLFCAPVSARKGGGQRIDRGIVPDLSVLVAAIAAVCRRHLAEPSGTAVNRRAYAGGLQFPLARARERLENLSLRLVRARDNYPAIHRPMALERRRRAKFGEMRRRLQAEAEAARHEPLAVLQGFQKALFLLKDSGWADDDGGPGTGRSANWDSWGDCLEDAAVLRWRLAARFAHPGLRYLLGSAVSV